MTALEPFRRATAVVDWRHPAVAALARGLGRGRRPVDVVRACFEWVRDRVPHTADHGLDRRFCLHGLNAVWLPELGWYRIDARGNRHDLRADFDPPRERLPYACRTAGERLFPGIWADPLPIVLEALGRHRSRAVLEINLPDAVELPSLAAGGVVAVQTTG